VTFIRYLYFNNFKDSQGSASYAKEYSGEKETEKSKDYSSIYSSLSGPALAR
jgi:hypothetical protein